MRTYRDRLMSSSVEFLLEEMSKQTAELLIAKRDLRTVKEVLQEKGVFPTSSSTDRYVICMLNACRPDYMFWSDKAEWTSLDRATVFSQEVKDRCPAPQAGEWMKLPPM